MFSGDDGASVHADEEDQFFRFVTANVAEPRYKLIRKTVIRNFDRAYQAVVDDYLCSNPTCDEATFRRRFRTSTNV
jgi:hypothetical protein